MKKAILCLLLTAVILTSSLAITSVHFSRAQNSATDVTGIINANTTWTQAGSPYTLTGNVLVNYGTTLTIQAGTVVNLGSYYIEVNGTLQAIGSNASTITFNQGQITFTQYSSRWDESSGTGSIIENAILSSSLLLYGAPMIFNNTVYGQITAQSTNGTPVISNNIVEGGINVLNGFTNYDVSYSFNLFNQNTIISNNTILRNGITVTETNATLCNNLVANCPIGISIYNEYIAGSIPQFCSENITGNLIVNNTYGIALNPPEDTVFPSITVENNSIVNNYDGIYFADQTGDPYYATISDNNIFNNSHFNLQTLLPNNNFNAAQNWWGTTDSQTIAQTIYDYYDDFNLGIVTYTPILTSPNIQAPTFVNSSTGAGGSISPNGIRMLSYGGKETFAMMPSAGYHVTGVYVNGTLVGAVYGYTIQNIDGATEITATFAANNPESWSVDSGTYVNGVHNWNPTTTESDEGTVQINKPQGQWYILYANAPQNSASFTISTDVNAQQLNSFELVCMQNLPMVSATDGFSCDIGMETNPGSPGEFTVAWNDGVWTWQNSILGEISTGTWYHMVLQVNSQPYTVTASVYDNATGALLSTYSFTPATPLFNQIGYVGFGAMENGGNYTVTNVSITSQPELVQDVQVVNWSWHLDAEGFLNVVGLVKNVGSNVIYSVTLNGKIVGSGGADLGDSSSPVWASYLLPNQEAPFYMEFANPPSMGLVSSIDLTVSNAPATAYYQYPDLAIVSSSASIGNSGVLNGAVNGAYLVDGTIQNTGTQAAANVTVVGAFFNSTGTVVSVGYTNYLNPAVLGPGDSTTFQVAAFDLNQSQVPAALQITSYQLLVQAQGPILQGNPPPTPSPTPTPTPTATPKPTPTPSLSPTPAPTPTPTPITTPKPTPTPTPIPSPTPTTTPTLVPTYTISITHVGSGTVSPADGQYAVSTFVTLQATPAGNYSFMCWLANGYMLSVNNPYVYAPTGNSVITAVFYDPSSKETPSPLPSPSATPNPTSTPTSSPPPTSTSNPTINPTASPTSSPTPPTQNSSSTATPSPSPAAPEFPCLATVLTLLTIMGLAAVLALKKRRTN